MGAVTLALLSLSTTDEAADLLAGAETSELLAAVADASDAEIHHALGTPLRDVVLIEILRRLPAFVNARKASDLRITVAFRVAGRPDGGVDRFVVRLDRGAAAVLTGAAADAVGRAGRNATVTCSSLDFLMLVTGHLSPITGVLRGHLRVRGDKAAALRLAGAFDIPTAVAG
ncbi:hypothetical protein F0U44_18710 [Nocardioides humilatus]|uniref:SCP2 domain-containing protein n=1 Tax=Nocardioides humilatus TaxID=2607660 RepID=A0A5B1L7A0_9ACTN|nr:SCP2 sterol-binding domain-containing protein [Nocardioides humilatus]KAA1416354.1 hypothetical protein F0U44_18710 [Nocardioides humilatus]